jgi:hypothetical protein
MDDMLAKKLHMLTKREREVMAKRKEIEEASTKYKPYEELRESAKKNPLAVLEHFGLSYDELTDYIINGQDPENVRYKELQDQINSLKSEKENEAKSAREAKEQNAVMTFKNTIVESLNPERHEFCAAHGSAAIDMVYGVIEAYWNEKGEMLDHTVALDWVEEHLEEQFKPILGLKKIQSKFQSRTSESQSSGSRTEPNVGTTDRGAFPPTQGQAQPPRQAAMPGQTINSQMSTSSVQHSTDDSPEARLARAAAFLKKGK